jgi:phage terminase large subunit-like protein
VSYIGGLGVPDRVISLPGGRRIFYDRLSDDERVVVDDELRAFFELVERNPVQAFEWHSQAQHDFLAARTPVVAAFAGNRFGKSTVLVVRALIECLKPEGLPERLRPFKRFEAPVAGWLLAPTEDKIFDSLKPAFERWTGGEFFKGGSWGKAFNGERMMLTFSNGSTISFKTYKQDPSTLGGASLHFVGYDEPPPREHREECLTRLADHDGFELFAMTPLNTNTGWVRREIFKKRESPDITVVRGSMHDNPTLSKTAVARILATYHNDLWRRAREFGDFVDVGGVIYEEFERCVIEPPVRDGLSLDDVVVGIDPGIRNAGIVFVAFDGEGVGTVFSELLLQDATVEDYARAIFGVLDAWGVRRSAPLFVIDPASRSRSQTNAQSVQSALAVLGIGCADGQNAVEAGIQQVRGRLQHRRLLISRSCVRLRDEADEYAAEDRPDGEFKPIKENDHLLDALRYACMARPWFPLVEQSAPDRNLGFREGRAIPGRFLTPAVEVPPMGSMS